MSATTTTTTTTTTGTWVRRGVLQARLPPEAGAHSDAPEREWAPYTFTLTADGVLACAAADTALFAVPVCGAHEAAGGAGVVAELADGARLTLAPLHPADGLAWLRALADAGAARGETQRGWLKVRGVTKQWSVRLLVLRPPVLAAYRDEEAAARGTALFAAHLRGCVCRERASKKDGFCFMVEHTHARPIYLTRGPHGEALPKVLLNADELLLRAPSAAEGRVWLECLARAIADADATETTAAAAVAAAALPPLSPSLSLPSLPRTTEEEEQEEEESVDNDDNDECATTPRSSGNHSARRHRSKGEGTDDEQLRQLKGTVQEQEATLARLAHQIALLEQQLAAQKSPQQQPLPPPCAPTPPAWRSLLPVGAAVLLVLVAVVSTSFLHP